MRERANFYEREMQGLLGDILCMATLVSRCLVKAMEAMEKQDKALAKNIVQADEEIDETDYEIEMKALELISLQQPARDDLRLLASVLRITKELERIGDYAVNIAHVAIKLADQGTYFKPLVDIPQMAHLVMEMLEMAMESFMKSDIDLAHRVAEADDPVDELFYLLQAELADWMKQSPAYVDQACQMALVVRYLERVGDHAVNIAEMCLFRATGERRSLSVGRPRRIR